MLNSILADDCFGAAATCRQEISSFGNDIR
jgi:hypothetical protein